MTGTWRRYIMRTYICIYRICLARAFRAFYLFITSIDIVAPMEEKKISDITNGCDKVKSKLILARRKRCFLRERDSIISSTCNDESWGKRCKRICVTNVPCPFFSANCKEKKWTSTHGAWPAVGFSWILEIFHCVLRYTRINLMHLDVISVIRWRVWIMRRCISRAIKPYLRTQERGRGKNVAGSAIIQPWLGRWLCTHCRPYGNSRQAYAAQ